MHLTDCAFLFFTGVSLRIWDPEIECDLPCHEEIFDAAHPFTHPDFSFRRPLTTQQAFSALFATDQPQTGPHTALTMLDSFVLIHSKPRMLTQSLKEWRPICVCYATSVVVEGEATPEMASRTEHGSLESATGNQQIGCTESPRQDSIFTRNDCAPGAKRGLRGSLG